MKLAAQYMVELTFPEYADQEIDHDRIAVILRAKVAEALEQIRFDAAQLQPVQVGAVVYETDYTVEEDDE